MNQTLFLDCESTGLSNHPIHKHPQAIEIAEIYLTKDIFTLSPEEMVEHTLNSNSFFSSVERFKPSMQIHRDATNIHGIFFKDLLKCRKSEEYEFPEGIKYLVGHNVSYDHRVLGKPKVELICTMALAKAIDKQFNLKFESHKLDDLISTLYGNEANDFISAKHSALNDTIKVILLLIQLLVYLPGIKSFDSLFQFQQGLKKSKKVANV